MGRDTINFEANQPQELSLAFPQGKFVKGQFGDRVMFGLSYPEGSVMFLDPGVAQKINHLEIQPGEHFAICKRPKNGSTPARWDVWLTDATRDMRAQHHAPPPPPEPTMLERQLAASIHEAQARKAPQSAPAPAMPTSMPSTGTHGPIPMKRPAMGPDAALLAETNRLIDVYAAAVAHGGSLGVSGTVVRTLLLSAYIGQSKSGAR